MKHNPTASAYHDDKIGNTWHLLKIIDTFLHCSGRHFQHDLRTAIDVSDLINYKMQYFKTGCSGLYSDGVRNDVFYAVQTYSVVGDVSTLRVEVSGV